MKTRKSGNALLWLCLLATPGMAQDNPTAPLPTPPMTGPLQGVPPNRIGSDAIPGLSVSGVISGLGLAQSNAVQGDQTGQATVSNAQIILQKTAGWWQFYVQAGAYDVPILGSVFLPADKTLNELFGPVPVAYLKLQAAQNTSILIGSLPTLMGAESTFTFQNMNISRGLLWNQENDVNRGVQVNQAMGRFTASVSWNDGFYSNRYSWVTGSLTYSAGPHSINFTGMKNLAQTAFRTTATPVQNNSAMYAAIYTLSKSGWILQPYFQYTDVPTNLRAGIGHGASTRGVALLLSRTLRDGFSLAARGEYLSSSGPKSAVNLLYGPGSDAWSATLTPTFQHGRFFIRGDVVLVRASRYTTGYAFGASGNKSAQARALVEGGFLF